MRSLNLGINVFLREVLIWNGIGELDIKISGGGFFHLKCRPSVRTSVWTQSRDEQHTTPWKRDFERMEYNFFSSELQINLQRVELFFLKTGRFRFVYTFLTLKTLGN